MIARRVLLPSVETQTVAFVEDARARGWPIVSEWVGWNGFKVYLRYRTDQNYIGETLPNYRQRIHFVPPPPQFVYSLMDGLGVFLKKSTGSHALMSGP